MNVATAAKALGLDILTGETALDREITGVYTCDLLSWVMSHAAKGNAWITVHTHINTVAVAMLVELSFIIVPDGIKVEEATIKKAISEGIAIASTNMSTYELCWKFHELLTA